VNELSGQVARYTPPNMTSDGMHPDPGASASGPMAVDALQPGELFDRRYRIVRKLGEGGMGEVYAAEHTTLQKRVAIKLLRPEIVSNHEAVKRFRQEATSSSSIGHPNIIRIEDFADLPDGRIYLCMELLDGAPLNDLIKANALSPDRMLNVMIQTGHGLSAAHAKGIVHRDMKPENIFVTHGGHGEDVPKILDFGIAKVAGNDGQNNLTRTGTIFGTPFYMAPEQALGQQVDGRVDIYAMGVILYEVFSGSLPFRGESFMGILTQHITTEPEPVAQRAAAAGRQLPPGIDSIIARAMVKDPERRYQTMEELVQALVGVYRAIAGSGMSAYMEAYQPPRTGALATPHAAQMPTVAAGVPGAPGYRHTPSPMAMAAGGSAVFPADQSALLTPPKKSNAGMIFAILAVLAVLGGGAALFVISQSKKAPAGDTGGTGTDHGTGAIGKGTGDSSGTGAAGGTGAGTAQGSGEGTGGGTQAAVTPDAGVAVATADAAVAAASPDAAVAKAEPIMVLVDANADGAKIYEHGKQVGKTPEMLKVVPGENRTLVIKHPKYKDKTIVIDGSDNEVRVSLDRKGGGGGGGGAGTGGGTAGSGSTTPPEDPRKKFCREHPDDLRCMTSP